MGFLLGLRQASLASAGRVRERKPKPRKPRAGFCGKVRVPMVKSRISSKGQITLPKRIRQVLGVGPGEEVEFEVRGNEVLLRPRREVPLESLLGRFRGKVSYPGEEREREAREKAWARAK